MGSLSLSISAFVLVTMLSVSCAMDYPYSLHILDNNEYVVHWNFEEARWIQLKLEVATHSWFGFGLSQTGGMRQADIMTFWVKEGVPFIQDRWSVGEEMPQRDRNSQDWELLHSSENATHTTAEVRRNIYTCDPEDSVVEYGTMRVIWARSDGDSDPEHADDITYHGTSPRSRGTKSVELLTEKDKNVPEKLEPDAFPLDMTMNKFEIPAVDTKYWCHAMEMPQAVQEQEHHFVMAEPVVQAGNEAYVHHVLVYDCATTLPKDVNDTSFDCENWFHPVRQSCTRILLGWGIGGGEIKYPKHVGMGLGGQHKGRYLMLEMHYDNPQLTRGRLDSSGMRLWLTPTRREHDAGVLTVQSGAWEHMFIPPRLPEHRVYGVCHQDCLSEAIDAAKLPKVKIFAFLLHTHLLGRGVVVRHFRGGEELKPLALDENYDFNFQEQREMAAERSVLPGDSLTVECRYDSTDRENMTIGSEGTRDEMCVAFIQFYPNIPLSVCGSKPTDRRKVEFLGGLGYEPVEIAERPYFKLNNPPEHITSQRSLGDVYRQLRWTPEVHRRYQQWIMVGEKRMECLDMQTRRDLKVHGRVERYDFDQFVKTDHEANPCSSTGAVTASLILTVAMLIATRRSH